MSSSSYEQLRARLKEAEETIRALAEARADAVVTEQGVHLLRLHKTDLALREAQEALRESEERFRLAQSAAHLIAWDWDLRTDFITLCGQYTHLYGLTPERTTLTYGEWLSVIHPDDRKQVQAVIRETLERTHILDTEFRVRWPDGTTHWLLAKGKVFLDDSGRPIRALGVSGDVTERKQAEETLRASEERLKRAERIAHIGHWDWDIKTNRVFWSEETFRIVGRPQDYIPSYEESFEIVSPQNTVRVEQWVRDCLAEKRGNSIEVQIARTNGDLRTLTLTSEVLLDENGMPARMVGTCQDVTDSRRAQNEAFARQKLETMGTLANGIAHDFNNLLGGMLAQADLALVELAAGSHPEEELQRIRDVAIHGAEIVRQLMVYAGKESEDLDLIDVSRIIKEMVDLLKVSVSRHATLETDLDMDLPAVRANAAQLRQIVMNLVTNASEAIGDRDGVIRVTTGHVVIDRVAAISKGVTEGDYVQLEVSDTGGGIPLETQASVFDPFFTTKSAGRGLGLAVVQGIVRKLGGVIHLASEPGKGTLFQILLPSEARVGATAGPIRSAAEAARPSRKATVLFVEDEDPLRQAIAKMLRKKGFEVLEAANGGTAIDLLRANSDKIDAILLDMTIPGRSSGEVVAEASQVRPDSKVILTSAYSEEMVMATMSSPLIRGFIRKPFQLGDLLQTLRNVVSS